MALRNGRLSRLVDLVIWPGCHEHVVRIVRLATDHNVALIPSGGNTNVSHDMVIPESETRMVVALDMTRMSRIKWIDKENMLACVEAGMRGSEMEEQLKQEGVCTGHDPDSVEFSTVGGWIATKCSGMKKNIYGNIEDMLVNFRMVTPKGTLTNEN